MEQTLHEIGYALFDQEIITREYLRNTIERIRPSYKIKAAGDSLCHLEKVLKEMSLDFIISGIYLSDGSFISAYRRMNCKIPTILFASNIHHFEGLEGINVVHKALKPIHVNEVERAICSLEMTLSS